VRHGIVSQAKTFLKMYKFALIAAAVSALSFNAMAQSVSPLVPALVKTAKLAGTPSQACELPGEAGAFAVALDEGGGKGQYAIVRQGHPAQVLSPFTGDVDLRCMSTAEAKAMADGLAEAEMVSGGIEMKSQSAVACARTDASTERCWQRPAANAPMADIGAFMN
jgi:hypothetical protein